MRTLRFWPSVLVVAVGLLAGSAEAADKIRVVASTTDLKALTEAVGGDLIDVDTLARGDQNPHDLEVRPSLMVKLRRADVLVINGLELDNWADVAVHGSNNPQIIRGGAGLIDASRGIQVLDVPTTRVDRSMGDVHALGNPHYTTDPGQASVVTANIVEGLSRVAPQHRAAFAQRREAFLGQLDQAMARWTKTMEPFRGAKVVDYHAQWSYLLARFGLVKVGTVEERPGIPAAPAHLARLIRQMKEDKVKVVVHEPWSDKPLASRVADEAGARAVLLAMVGAVKGTESYISTVDRNVNALAQALR